MPNSRPAKTDSPAANATIVPSAATAASPGTARGTRTGAVRTIPAATATPTVPPTRPRTTLSVSSWRTTLPRPAPSAPRTTSSRRRAMPRASNQARHVRAGQQQRQPGSSPEHRECRPQRAPPPFLQADHARLGCAIRCHRPGFVDPPPIENRAHLGCRLIRRDLTPQTPETNHPSGEVVQLPISGRLERRHDERSPELRRTVRRLEAWGHDSDHDVRLIFDLDPDTDRIRIRSESALPQGVAQKDDPGRSLHRIRDGEEPAELRRRPQQGEEGRSHCRSEEVAVRSVPPDEETRDSGKLLEGPGVLPKCAQFRIRERRRPRPSWPYLSG